MLCLSCQKPESECRCVMPWIESEIEPNEHWMDDLLREVQSSHVPGVTRTEDGRYIVSIPIEIENPRYMGVGEE